MLFIPLKNMNGAKRASYSRKGLPKLGYTKGGLRMFLPIAGTHRIRPK